jgi:hypothetical protein
MNKIIIVLALFCALVTAAFQINAQSAPPQVTTLCERKDGALYSVNDGFSIRKACYANSREVSIGGGGGLAGPTGPAGATGQIGPQGATGPIAQRGAGTIAFVYESFSNYVSIVSTDKQLYYYSDDTAGSWRPVSELNIWGMPDSVPLPVEEIIDINQFHLIDKNGNVWFFRATSPSDRQWVNLGHP